MSTILKALQRLEEEKRPQPELSLDEQIGLASPAEKPRSRGVWLAAASGIAGMTVAAATIYFWPTKTETIADPPAVAAAATTPRSDSAGSAQNPDPQLSPKPAPNRYPPARANARNTVTSRPAAPIAPPAPQPQVSSEIEVVRQLQPVPDVAAPREASPDSIDQPRDPRVRDRALAFKDGLADSVAQERSRARAASLAGIEIPSAAGRSKAAPAKTPAVAIAARPSVKSPVEPEPAPSAAKPERVRKYEAPPAPRVARANSIEDPPPAKSSPPPRAKKSQKSSSGSSAAKPDHKVVLRAKLPEFKVRSTVWHPERSRRVAVVDWDGGEMLELNEGDALGPLVVESIKPGGVFFTHDGVSVLHPVGR